MLRDPKQFWLVAIGFSPGLPRESFWMRVKFCGVVIGSVGRLSVAVGVGNMDIRKYGSLSRKWSASVSSSNVTVKGDILSTIASFYSEFGKYLLAIIVEIY